MAIGSRARAAGPSAFGDARPFGTQIASGQSDVVAIAASPRYGYWVATKDGTVGMSTANLSSPSSHINRRPGNRVRVVAAHERRARGPRPAPGEVGSTNSRVTRTVGRTRLVTSKPIRHQDLGAIVVGANGRLEEVGENLFAGAGSAADAGTAHLALMASAEHRAEHAVAPGSTRRYRCDVQRRSPDRGRGLRHQHGCTPPAGRPGALLPRSRSSHRIRPARTAEPGKGVDTLTPS